MKTFTTICVVTIALFAILHEPGAVLAASGNGTQQPTVSLSPTQLWFIYGCHSTLNPAPVTLTNNGPGVLDISRITTTGPFSQTHTCGSTLGVGGSCTILVKWATGANGAGSLVITDNGVGNPQSVYLRGWVGCIK